MPNLTFVLLVDTNSLSIIRGRIIKFVALLLLLLDVQTSQFKLHKCTHNQEDAICNMHLVIWKQSSATLYSCHNHCLIATNRNELDSDVPYGLRTAPTVKISLDSQRLWQRQRSRRDSAMSVKLGCLIISATWLFREPQMYSAHSNQRETSFY